MKDILTKYKTSIDGLSSQEVIKRQEIYGLNELEEKKPTPVYMLFLSQFVDILIALLLIAAIAAYAIGDVIDACVIILAVLLNTILGFIQEYRSQKAVETLKSMMVKRAIVKRENHVEEIDSKLLTVGDIVILEEGNKSPADLTLIEAKNLSCDESYLTGESESVLKEANDDVYSRHRSKFIIKLRDFVYTEEENMKKNIKYSGSIGESTDSDTKLSLSEKINFEEVNEIKNEEKENDKKIDIFNQAELQIHNEDDY